MQLEDYAVMSVPGFSTSYLYYDVAVQPFDTAPFVIFKVQFALV
jgi:hypothetical protein